MSSAGSAPCLRIDLVPSRWLARALTFAWAMTAVSLLTLPWPWWLSLPAAIAAAAAGGWHLRWRRTRAISGLAVEVGEEGQACAWSLEIDGELRSGYRLLADSWVHHRLVILNFHGPDRRSLVLLPDCLDGDDFRRLRARLKGA